MFDVGFVELLVIGVVALLVLGPERLPAAARTVGGLLRRARHSWNSLRGEFEREFAAEEIKRSIGDTARQLDIGADLRRATAGLDPMAPASTPTPEPAQSEPAQNEPVVAASAPVAGERAPHD